jgi:hypothetical protein
MCYSLPITFCAYACQLGWQYSFQLPTYFSPIAMVTMAFWLFMCA